MELKKHFANVEEIIEKFDFEKEQKTALLNYAKKFSNNEKLILLAQNYYDLIFNSNEPVDVIALKEEDGLEQGMLFAIIYLVRCELFASVLAQKGIPEKYSTSAIWHYKDLFKKNFDCYGFFGFTNSYRKGMIQYVKPITYRIGRLSFEMTTITAPYIVYKNKKTGKHLPLVNDGQIYLLDGKPAPRNFQGETFTATITEDDNSVKGYTVNEKGELVFDKITLSKSDYEVVLKTGDNALSVHIPGNEKMSEDIIKSSFIEAKAFFDKYHSDTEFKAFYCSSWLLDTGFERFLKPESNILKFQKNFKVVLSFVNTFSIYWHIFGVQNFVPYSELVPSNDFQRKVLDFVMGGGNIYSGNGYILYNEIK